MQNAECRMQTRIGRFFLHSAFCILHFAALAAANELTADKRSITLTDSLTITLTLTDNFAQLDNVRLSVQNLVKREC